MINTADTSLKNQIANLNQAAQELGIKQHIDWNANGDFTNQLEQMLEQFVKVSKEPNISQKLSETTLDALLDDVAVDEQNNSSLSNMLFVAKNNSPGALSQVINKTEDNLKNIAKINQLPGNAVIIRKKVADLVTDVLNKTKTVQEKALNFTASASSTLREVQTSADRFIVRYQNILKKIQKVQDEAKTLATELDNLQIQEIRSQFATLLASSQKTEAELQAKVSSSNANVKDLQKKIKDAERKQRSASMAGIGGAPAALAASILSASLGKQLKALRQTLADEQKILQQASTFAHSVQSIDNEYKNLLQGLGEFKNKLDLIIQYNQRSIENLEQAKDKNLLKLYVNTTFASLETLQDEVS